MSSRSVLYRASINSSESSIWGESVPTFSSCCNFSFKFGSENLSLKRRFRFSFPSTVNWCLSACNWSFKMMNGIASLAAAFRICRSSSRLDSSSWISFSYSFQSSSSTPPYFFISASNMVIWSWRASISACVSWIFWRDAMCDSLASASFILAVAYSSWIRFCESPFLVRVLYCSCSSIKSNVSRPQICKKAFRNAWPFARSNMKFETFSPSKKWKLNKAGGIICIK